MFITPLVLTTIVLSTVEGTTDVLQIFNSSTILSTPSSSVVFRNIPGLVRKCWTEKASRDVITAWRASEDFMLMIRAAHETEMCNVHIDDARKIDSFIDGIHGFTIFPR